MICWNYEILDGRLPYRRLFSEYLKHFTLTWNSACCFCGSILFAFVVAVDAFALKNMPESKHTTYGAVHGLITILNTYVNWNILLMSLLVVRCCIKQMNESTIDVVYQVVCRLAAWSTRPNNRMGTFVDRPSRNSGRRPPAECPDRRECDHVPAPARWLSIPAARRTDWAVWPAAACVRSPPRTGRTSAGPSPQAPSTGRAAAVVDSSAITHRCSRRPPSSDSRSSSGWHFRKMRATLSICPANRRHPRHHSRSQILILNPGSSSWWSWWPWQWSCAAR